MGFINTIAGLFRKRRIKADMVHPVLGELTSDAVGNDNDIWQSEVVFTPLDREIGLTIYAGLGGPKESQVEFYRKFEAGYKDEFARIAPLLLGKFEAWFGRRREFDEAFRFVALTIPKNGDRKNTWSLSFDCIADPNLHMYTAELRGDSVVGVSIDG